MTRPRPTLRPESHPCRPPLGAEPRRATIVVTMTCPTCGRPFEPTGRRRYCSDACRAAAYIYRRRRNAAKPALVLPEAQPRRPITVYECDDCGARARVVGHQYCEDCRSFMRRVGFGGHCPACGEPVAITELGDDGLIVIS